MNLKTFGERVVFLIEKKSMEPNNQDFNQTLLAKKCGMSKSALSQHINGKLKASPKTIVKIAQALDCSPKWLKNGEGDYDLNFNDYLFEDNKNNPQDNSQKIFIEKYSKDIFELRILIKKKQLENIFETFLKIS